MRSAGVTASLATLLALLVSAPAWGQNDLQPMFYSCLSATGAEVVLPSDPSYSTASKQANGLYDNLLPLAIVYASTVEDVQQVVKCAKQYSVHLIPRSGGHSVMGLSVRQGAVTLDVSRMHAVTVSPDATTATVQAGAFIGQVYYAAATSSGGTKGYPGGVCPNVGVGGHLPGGGIGYLTRSYGFACDHILALKMVSATGEVVVADDTQNQDLLWAACGSGGGSLGVTVEYTVQLVDVPQNVTVWSAFASMNDAAAIAEYYQSWAPQLPHEMGTFLNLIQKQVIHSGLYLGPADEASRILEESNIMELADWLPGSFIPREMPWIQAVALLSNDPYYSKNFSNMATRDHPEGALPFASKSKSYNVFSPLPEDALDALVHFANYTPGGWVAFQAWGGRMAEIPANATAFPWRNAIMNIFYSTSWVPGQASAATISSALTYLTQAQEVLSPYIPYQASYLNYLDTDLASWPTAYWGDNAPRLQEVKRQYDPTDFFSNELVLTTTQSLT
ncbi:hypothetical protein N2152v2_005780 [Parachlorella kessleri]